MSSNNFQTKAPDKGWNDAPVNVKHTSSVSRNQLIALIISESTLQPLVDDIKANNVEDVVISLVYDYLTTKDKQCYQKLISGYFEKYSWLPELKKIVNKN